MSQVHEELEARRGAERRLEIASDPLEIPALRAEVERFHEAYRKAVDPSGDHHRDLMEHRVPTDHSEPQT
jgi:hypothetical protein